MEANNKRITKEQKFFLVQYLEEHMEFAHDRFVNDAGAKSLQEQWAALATSLNACGGAYKDGEGWKKAWVNMRSKTKQKFQELKSLLEATGNNSVTIKELSDLDERIIGVMSKVAVEGQVEVAEPLRSSRAVNTVSILGPNEEYLDIQYIDDEDVCPSLLAPNANSTIQEPQRKSASRKKTPSVEENMLKLSRLEEKKYSTQEEILATQIKRNKIAENQLTVLEQLLEETQKRNEIEKERNEIEKERNAIEKERNYIKKERNEIEKERNEIEQKRASSF